MPHERRDIVVIGTGFGGAVAACRLAQAGAAPLVLERGRRYDPGDFPSMPAEGDLFPDLAGWSFGQDGGLWDVVDLGPVRAVMAAGYGGGSLIYANVHMRAPSEVLATWPAPYRARSFGAYYDRVAAMLDVRPYRKPMPKRDALVSVADLLGRKAQLFEPALAITLDAKPNDVNEFGRAQKPCDECGECCTGCNRGAKNTLDRNYLAKAEDAGAEVRTQAEVIAIERVEPDVGSGYRIRYLDHLRGGIECSVTADYVFLGAGAVHTTRLLLVSQLGPQGAVGSRYFGNSDAIAMVYDAQHALHPTYGPTITTALLHTRPSGFPNGGRDEWFMVQDGGYPAALHRAFGMLRAPLFADRNRYAEKPLDGRTIAKVAEPPARPPPPPAPRPERPGSMVDAALTALDDPLFDVIVPATLRRSLDEARARGEKALRSTIEATIEGMDRTLEERLVAAGELAHPSMPRWFLRLVAKAERGLMRVALRTFAKAGFVDASDDSLHRHLLPQPTKAAQAAEWLKKATGMLGEGDGRDVAPDHRAMLLAMGRDDPPRSLVLDLGAMVASESKELGIYDVEERLFRDYARSVGGELRVNPLWSYEQETVTVHSQGGCPMPFGGLPGAVDENCELIGAEGLYLVDSSVFPTPVGANPSATIAAVAERTVSEFIRNVWLVKRPDRRAAVRAMRRDVASTVAGYMGRFHHYFGAPYARRGELLSPPAPSVTGVSPPPESEPIGLTFSETMRGFVISEEPPASLPHSFFLECERYGRDRGEHVVLELRATIRDVVAFTRDANHTVALGGHVLTFDAKSGRPTGRYALTPKSSLSLMPLAMTGASGSRAMVYDLEATDGATGRRLHLHGEKYLSDEPGFDAWEDTTALYTAIDFDGSRMAFGMVRLSMEDFVQGMLKSFEALGTDDERRQTWAVAAFATFFFTNLQKTYLPGLSALVREIGVR